MKDQVTSIEQSKRLIELGVPTERASMVWEMDEDCARLKIWNTDEETRRILHNKYLDYYAPAFTVADLLAVLPKTIKDDNSVLFFLNIQYTRKGYSEIEYKSMYGILWSCFGAVLLNNLVEAVDGLVTNGYELNL